MNPSPIAREESGPGPTGGAPALAPVLARVRAWTGDGALALILSGSHARGDAVRVRTHGRELWLSDLDLWAVMPERESRAAARARRAADRLDDAAREALGFASAVEVAFVLPEELEALPAKPGTLELRGSGVVLAGDPAWLQRVPDFAATAIPLEERRLLLENRAFELLWAWPRLAREGLPALAARHAVLKAVADLASVRALASGLLPPGPAERIAWARGQAPPEVREGRLDLPAADWERLWQAATGWRARPAQALPGPAAREEWRHAVRAWCETWQRHAFPALAGADPFVGARRSARRAPLRRRIRQALEASGDAAGPLARTALRSALRGTPRHRVHASATVLLMAAAGAGDRPSLPAGALRALARLGVLPADRRREWGDAAAALFAIWDGVFHDGQRTEALA